MANYGHIIFFSLIGGVFSLIGGIILLSRRKWAENLATYATPFAAGALLSAVFLDLLSEGVELADSYSVMLSALIGMIIFFMASRFLRWFHHHHEHESKASDPTTGLVIIGDTMHNALDGVAIAASFLISVPTGIVTTIAVAAHEIPQEIGDFGILLNKGLSRKKVLVVNIISALATTVMAVITFWLGSSDALPIGVLLGISAGFLLYIAASDIIPSIHDEIPKGKLFDVRPLLLIVGAVVVGITIQLAHGYIDAGHGHDSSNSNSTSMHDEDGHEGHNNEEHGNGSGSESDHSEDDHDH